MPRVTSGVRSRRLAAVTVITLAVGAASPAVAVAPASPVANHGNSVALSPDGRWLAFSTTEALVTADTNTKRDVYLKDMVQDRLYLVSDPAGPASANADSDPPDLNATFPGKQFASLDVSIDGRYVVFVSRASNLVPGDTNAKYDVFRWTRTSGAIALVSARSGSTVSANGYSSHPHISGDGRFVVFQSYATNLTASLPSGRVAGVNGLQVLVRDMATATSRYVSMRPGGAFPSADCSQPDISADGRFVVFASAASDLLAGDANGKRDIFRRSLISGGIGVISKTSTGAASPGDSYLPSVSGDGRFVAFESDAALSAIDTHVGRDIYVRDTGAALPAAIVSLASFDGSGSASSVQGDLTRTSISADGRRVTYRFDDGAMMFPQVTVAQWRSKTIVTAFVDADSAVISGNGRFVAVIQSDIVNPGQPTRFFRLSSASYAGTPNITISAGKAIITDAESGVAQVTVNGQVRRLGALGATPVSSGDVVKAWNGAGTFLRVVVP